MGTDACCHPFALPEGFLPLAGEQQCFGERCPRMGMAPDGNATPHKVLIPPNFWDDENNNNKSTAEQAGSCKPKCMGKDVCNKEKAGLIGEG